MRIRTVKPEFYKHEGLFELEKETGLPIRLAFTGLWCASDRDGRFKWRPRQLGIDILPYDGIDFSRVLDALGTRGFIVKYRVGNEWYGAIPTFKRHQVINVRERASELPDVSVAAEVDLLLDASGTREARVGHAGTKEGKGKEGKGTGQNDDASVTRQAHEPEEPAPTSEEAEREAPELSDTQWLEGLKKHDAYAGIDVGVEYSKMLVWCSVNNKRPNRRRFVNWLNRVDRPMDTNGAPHTRPALQVPVGVQLKAIDEEIAKHPANHENPRAVSKPTQAQMDDLNDLKRKRKDLISKTARA